MAALPIMSAADHAPGAVDHSDLHGAEIVDRVLLIPTHQIEVGERLRSVDPVWAEALGRIMQREGQRTPVEVCRLPGKSVYTLVAGGHRHAGAVSAGIAYLTAIQVHADRDQRRMREVSENLWRKDLDPIDRAAFVAELVTIHRRRVGLVESARRDAKVNLTHAKAINTEAADMLDTMSSTYGWTEELAEQLGYSGRTIRRDLFVYRRLAPSLVQRLRDARHPVAGNATQLRALAKLDDRLQARAVDMLLAGEARSAAEAVKVIERRPVPDAGAKRLSTVLGTLQRMSAAERLALFQSDSFQALAPAEARKLLAPMLRDGEARA
jgi:ParB-like chromosome segregation protein Spo0J